MTMAADPSSDRYRKVSTKVILQCKKSYTSTEVHEIPTATVQVYLVIVGIK